MGSFGDEKGVRQCAPTHKSAHRLETTSLLCIHLIVYHRCAIPVMTFCIDAEHTQACEAETPSALNSSKIAVFSRDAWSTGQLGHLPPSPAQVHQVEAEQCPLHTRTLDPGPRPTLDSTPQANPLFYKFTNTPHTSWLPHPKSSSTMPSRTSAKDVDSLFSRILVSRRSTSHPIRC